MGRPAACARQGKATTRDKEGGHCLWQADSMVEPQTPAWWSRSIPTPPIREGPVYLSSFSWVILRLRSGAGGGPRVSQLCPAWRKRVGDGFTGLAVIGWRAGDFRGTKSQESLF